MICDNCKQFFTKGNRPNGIPNGVKFVLTGNKSITLCARCICDMGAMSDRDKEMFLDRLKENAKQEG
jgi:hypothetical protein